MSYSLDVLKPGGLLAPTPAAWFEVASERVDELLIDHANCEKKAASTALALMFTYADDTALAERMSRLAREELRHFEQVQKLLRNLEIPWRRLSPSRYADGMRRAVRSREPHRLVDLLLCGALIEARSCERFIGLTGHLAGPIGPFYAGLAASEARHASLYVRLAGERATGDAAMRLDADYRRLAEIEAELATGPDREFRFHSGRPDFAAAV
ncbi:MAG TPA: tRNA isopentenyl-2-thiomethyl-A-37 hydroxylase MiaE [Steroidobacteraceae bacterium]|nr:tRNA isopentenyl-2-thiomethyl-A-37 hydroxylase MiaE [Steroidobacteraceae bacterium]